MQELERFRYATAFYFSIGNYTIRLDFAGRDMCTIITPWGEYKYFRLPMGIMCSPDIFQENMSNLMEDFEFGHTYLSTLLYFSKGNFDEHLEVLEKILNRLRKANL